jgi:acyl dehydratase
MALKTDIRGMVWKYPDTFVVGREQVRQYAAATKSNDPASHDEEAAAELGHDSLVAPLTFVSILANMIQKHFFQHVDIGLETKQIVQVDQKFLYHQPIKAGDELQGTMYVLSVDERFGADIVVTRNVVTKPETGEMVLEAYTTVMGHEGDNSISVKWDPESGQVMRTAAGE